METSFFLLLEAIKTLLTKTKCSKLKCKPTCTIQTCFVTTYSGIFKTKWRKGSTSKEKSSSSTVETNFKIRIIYLCCENEQRNEVKANGGLKKIVTVRTKSMQFRCQVILSLIEAEKKSNIKLIWFHLDRRWGRWRASRKTFDVGNIY